MVDKILFFDGVCAMCNRLVHFVLKNDRKHLVKFATLQGNTARERIPETMTIDLKSVVFLDHDGIHTESDAIIRLFQAMGGIFALAFVLRIFPRFLRNAVYRFVAHNRYRWFGTTEACALLTPQEKTRVLD